MEKAPETKTKPLRKNFFFWLILALVAAFVTYSISGFTRRQTAKDDNRPARVKSAETKTDPPPRLDFGAYDKKLQEIANSGQLVNVSSTASSTTPRPDLPPWATPGSPSDSPGPQSGNGKPIWPVKTAYPNYGALLPFNRIVAYYGNLYSRYMGILGQYPQDEMLDRLSSEVAKWQAADPATPVVPALHYVAVVAQAGPGRNGKYIARMPDAEIDKVLAMAKKINGIVFLDIQVGQSSVQTEVPLLEKYLKLPNVHLGIDPEFAMNSNHRPGTVIGTMDAADINFAAGYLAQIVKDANLPPKILVIHRFTQGMVTNYRQITPLPEVQIVMNMDGFGGQAKKINTYKQFIYKEPVQFTGFKLFYKNDTAADGVITPERLLRLTPIPSYIQYQ